MIKADLTELILWSITDSGGISFPFSNNDEAVYSS